MKPWWQQPRFWFGIVFSALFLYLAFRNVQWAQLAAALRNVNWVLLASAVGLFVVNLGFRSLRWQTLLAPLGRVEVGEAFACINIGYMANNLLPLRAGEIIRCALLGEKKGLSKSAVLATVVVERLLDVLSAGALALVLMGMMPVLPLIKRAVLLISAAGCVIMVVLWWAAGRTSLPGRARLPNSWLVSRGSGRLGELLTRLQGMVRSFGSGLVAIRSPRQVLIVVGYSVLTWSAVIAYAWLVLRACNLPLPLTGALMVTVLVNFGAAIPSSPGFIGVSHFMAVLALSPWAIEQNQALGFAVVFHAIGFLVTVVLGIVLLGRENVTFGRLAAMNSTQVR